MLNVSKLTCLRFYFSKGNVCTTHVKQFEHLKCSCSYVLPGTNNRDSKLQIWSAHMSITLHWSSRDCFDNLHHKLTHLTLVYSCWLTLYLGSVNVNRPNTRISQPELWVSVSEDRKWDNVRLQRSATTPHICCKTSVDLSFCSISLQQNVRGGVPSLTARKKLKCSQMSRSNFHKPAPET